MRVYWADVRALRAALARRPGRSNADGSAFAWSLLERAALEVWGLKALPETALNEAGKPTFSAYPSLHFSLSHTKGVVLAALSDVPVGADVERRREIPDVVRARLFEVEHGDLELFELWTLRESWFKLTGHGDLRDIPFTRHGGILIPPNPSALCRLYDTIPGCACAVSTLRDIPPDSLIQVDPKQLLRHAEV
jgi:phosphopantetheinyl transferase